MIHFIITCDFLLTSPKLWLLWEFISLHLTLSWDCWFQWLSSSPSQASPSLSRYIDFVHWMTFVENNRLVFLLIYIYIYICYFIYFRCSVSFMKTTAHLMSLQGYYKKWSLEHSKGLVEPASFQDIIFNGWAPSCRLSFCLWTSQVVWRCLSRISRAFTFSEFLSWILGEEQSTELSSTWAFLSDSKSFCGWVARSQMRREFFRGPGQRASRY